MEGVYILLEILFSVAVGYIFAEVLPRSVDFKRLKSVVPHPHFDFNFGLLAVVFLAVGKHIDE